MGDVRIEVSAKVTGVDDITAALKDGLTTLSDVKGGIRKYTEMAHARAVQNVSGVESMFKGNFFLIYRRTGKLARSFRVTYPNALSSIIVNEANYASYVEEGHPAFDMKPYLMGKTIPLPVRGGNPRATSRRLRASTGRKSKVETIAFRRIGPNTKGWIIPAAQPRPFMAAAGEYIEPLFSAGIDEILRRAIERAVT
jgi:hypothetical protein